MLVDETITFFAFILYGFLISIVYDFFRALRRVRKSTYKSVLIQDIIYIIIAVLILVIFIYKYINKDIRLYLIFSSLLGIVIYYSILGNFIRRIFEIIINLWREIFDFIFITFTPYKKIYDMYLKKIIKYVKKCCKKNIYMINSKCNMLKHVITNLYKREGTIWKTKFQKKKRIQNKLAKNTK